MRKLLMGFIGISLLIMCVGCGVSPYEEYTAAVEKTENIKKVAYEAELNTKADIDTEDLTTKEKRQYNIFKNLRVNIQGKRDDTKGQTEQVIRYNLNGIGFDITYYQDRESKMLKLPFLDKYILIESTEDLIDEKNYIMPAQETIDGWEALWLEIVEEDKVFRAEKDLVETPEGEIKATKYVIEIEGQSLKTFVIKSIDLLLTDEKFVNSIEEEVNFSFRTVLQESRIDVQAVDVENLVFESFVSIDQYIIKEVFKTTVSFQELDMRMKSIDIRYEGILYDINKEQNIELPVISQENMTTIKEFQETFPITIEGFKN